ncbi:Hypothetical predicted protein [Octopus vulgaris]|uniref:Uncharacterized protein n=1 Tax=Octopus vulgaris TaxID=6645 RepID=A0AA36AU93_OCTVU|nr:Hypothetical predicted protein [Octopus vulgaris]
MFRTFSWTGHISGSFYPSLSSHWVENCTTDAQAGNLYRTSSLIADPNIQGKKLTHIANYRERATPFRTCSTIVINEPEQNPAGQSAIENAIRRKTKSLPQ